MAFFLVTMAHPDGGEWGEHLTAHVDYLQGLLASGKLRASGALKDLPLRTGFLIIVAADRAEVEAIVADDPFALEGLIETLTIVEWDPLFGAFASESSVGGDPERLADMLRGRAATG